MGTTKRLPQKNQPLTVMIVPRSGKVVSFSIGSETVRRLATILAVVLLVAGLYTIRYNVLTKQVVELSGVKQVNAQQREQIDEISTDLDTVKQDLERVKDLERRVRELLGSEREVLNKKLASSVDNVLDANYARQVLSPRISRSLPRDGRAVPGGDPVPNADPASPATTNLQDLSLDVRATKDQIAFLTAELSTTAARLETIIAEAKAMPSYFPVAGGKVTSTFGGRRSPFGTYVQFHEGVDIAAKYGSSVYAAGSGAVTFTGYKSGLGLTVVIDHGNGVTTTYGHLSKVQTTKGSRVNRGAVIGNVGTTGRVTGPHLHYEMRKNGQLQDPMKYLQRAT